MRIMILVAAVMASVAGCASTTPQEAAPSDVRSAFTTPSGSRAFVVHRPARSGNRSLVVMLHGCTQDAADIARGTRMDDASNASGFAVLYPEQPVSAHPQKCRNWYTPAPTGQGEASLLAALIDSVARAEGVPAQKIALIGMSAGGAMAATLAALYPERYGALVVHSGIAAMAASDVAGALKAMRSGAPGAVLAKREHPLSVLLLHGRDDKVVSPANADELVIQWTAANAGTTLVEKRMFDGVGHAWSGGSAAGTYTAPNGPDATALIMEFLKQHRVI